MNQNSRCEEFTSAGCFHPEIFTDLRKFNLFREQTLKNLIIQSKKFTFSTSKKVCLHFVKCKPSNMLKRCIFCTVWSGSNANWQCGPALCVFCRKIIELCGNKSRNSQSLWRCGHVKLVSKNVVNPRSGHTAQNRSFRVESRFQLPMDTSILFSCQLDRPKGVNLINRVKCTIQNIINISFK